MESWIPVSGHWDDILLGGVSSNHNVRTVVCHALG
ncbi:hypothetical protein WD_0746 [Wolbachia endosymbiont of Drosophila melanogaster]|nr:hypothetical protein WD_0746 [Wolbachia endosymbiont of Drosophila melanogaster]